MSFFSKILDKLGLKKEEKTAAAATAAKPATPVAAKPAAPAAAKPVDVSSLGRAEAKPVQPIVHKPAAISEVDVVKQLESMASGSGLNWKVSIVDLLKVLGIDSSLDARKELATELGCPAEFMGDSAKMNVWLHKEVLKKIAENGGNIPASMLD
ncbi:MAG: DUF3597 domain-containing protein [Anaerolineales bacterium]